MPIPGSATDLTLFPDWTNLQDTWREIDAEWLRNRSIQIFATAAARTTAIATPPLAGMLSANQAVLVSSPTAVGGPDFYNGTTWESIRYPNLNVSSLVGPPASVTLKYQGASPSNGIQLLSNGSVNMTTVFIGTGTGPTSGTTMDATGVSIQIGTKAVKLSTDTTSLLVNSPVSITGALTTTGTVTAPTLAATTSVTTPLLSLSGPITGATAIGATTVTATASVSGGDVILGASGIYGTVKHRTTGSAQVNLGSDSTVQILGTSVTVTPPLTVTGALTANGQTDLKAQAYLSPPSKTAVYVAGVIAQSGNVAPTANAPDGTIYITY